MVRYGCNGTREVKFSLSLSLNSLGLSLFSLGLVAEPTRSVSVWPFSLNLWFFWLGQVHFYSASLHGQLYFHSASASWLFLHVFGEKWFSTRPMTQVLSGSQENLTKIQIAFKWPSMSPPSNFRPLSRNLRPHMTEESMTLIECIICRGIRLLSFITSTCDLPARSMTFPSQRLFTDTNMVMGIPPIDFVWRTKPFFR